MKTLQDTCPLVVDAANGRETGKGSALHNDGGPKGPEKQGGAIIHIVLTVLFFSVLSVLTFTQFEGQSDRTEAQAAMTEMVTMVSNAQAYYVSNGNSYVGIDANHLGISDNLYGEQVDVQTAGTATAVELAYEGFPNEEICESVSLQLRRMDFIDSTATDDGVQCISMGTMVDEFETHITMDDSR